MKNIIAGISLSLFLVACGGSASEYQSQAESTTPATVVEAALPTPDTFKSSFELALNGYFELKDALVQTDAASASARATALLATMQQVDTNGLSAEAAMLWEVAGQDAAAATALLAAETDVEVQRVHFEPLSNALIDMVKSYGPFGNALFVQRCPMVRGGSADWISKEEQVMNPYHGSRMLNCGSVIERI
jgi:hypothetical protein